MTPLALYTALIEAYLFSELNTLMAAARMNPRKLADAIGKHVNTVRAWLNGERLPDTANIGRICDKTGAGPERTAFMVHLSEQLRLGPELISNLDQRNIFLVESAERNYPVISKWNPILFSALVQTEPVHMKLLAGPMEDPASKIKNWLRKERRAENFFARLAGKNPPTAEIFVPASAIADLDRLTSREKCEQIDRLLFADSFPTCEVLVVEPPHLAGFPFESFSSNGSASAGPDFVYVENLDQSRHVVDPDKLGLYDQARSFLRTGSQGIGRFLDGGTHQLAEEHPE